MLWSSSFTASIINLPNKYNSILKLTQFNLTVPLEFIILSFEGLCKRSITFAELAELDAEKITALTSCYTKSAPFHGVPITQLSALYEEDQNHTKFIALTSDDAVAAMRDGGIAFAILEKFDATKITALTSKGALAVMLHNSATFGQPAKLATFNVLSTFDVNKITALTSSAAIISMESKLVTFVGLSALYNKDPNKFLDTLKSAKEGAIPGTSLSI